LLKLFFFKNKVLNDLDQSTSEASVREMIDEVSTEKNGTISFYDFMKVNFSLNYIF